MKLQVLVATMKQQDFSLADSMNIRCNAVIANQTENYGYEETTYDFGTIKMISTPTRGVGLNRNIALLASEADVLLFADDDMYYYDGSLEGVKKAFEENPDADVIIFSVNILQNGMIIEQRHCRDERVHVWNAMKYGTYSIAIRRSAVLQANLKFNELFGGGCMYSCGEDSLFLKACFDKGLKVYTNSYLLGERSKDSSSWFTGFNEKYFYDRGVLLYYLFPRLKWLMVLYYAYRFRGKTDLKLTQMVSLIRRGLKEAPAMQPYNRGGRR